jgi:Ser-tRNA(Ala) deacylase AlaX
VRRGRASAWPRSGDDAEGVLAGAVSDGARDAGNIAEILPEIAGEALRITRADQPILSAFSDEATGQRYWEIAGFSRVPCGGMHLWTTGEVGGIELKRKNIGKAKERIEIYLESPLVPLPAR